MSQSDVALIPTEEKQIDFYGDEITAALVEVEGKSEVYVPIRPIAEYLGLNWSGQFSRLKRDPVLSEEQGVCIIQTPSGVQSMICLPLKILPGWLFGINAARVKEGLREKIIRYQRECFEVLWQAFQNDALTVVAPPQTNQAIVALNQIREMGIAITRMAEQQIEAERRLDTHESRLNQAAQVVGNLQHRMNAVERTVLPGAIISTAQAGNISTAVKSLAEFMTSATPGKNHYQAIFAELYRRFRVSDYNHIRQADYRAVLDFLADWGRSAGAGVAPEQGLMELEGPGQE